MSTHWRDGRALPIAWSIENGDGPVQGPLALEFVRGRRLDLFLAAGQYALLLEGDRLRAVFRPGRHRLDVGGSTGALDPRWRLLFLAFGDGLTLRWTAESPLRCGADGALGLIGTCRIAVGSPETFHGTFLAGVDRPEASLVLTLIDRLAQAAVAACLASAGPDSPPLSVATLQARLTQLRPTDLAEALAPCGLACQELALYTASAPVDENARGAEPAGIGAAIPMSGHSEDLRRH